MQLLAPAKINLHLRVGRRRDDGFHPLLSWMCTVGLFDTLTLEADAAAVLSPRADPPPAAPSGAVDVAAGADLVRLELCGDSDRPDLPRGEDNLVVRIATAFVDELRRERPLGPARPDRQAQGPALREEGFQEPGSAPAARAAAAGAAGSTASAGAAPRTSPGTGREDASGVRDGRPVGNRAGLSPTEHGLGAVRDAEGSGRLGRRDVPPRAAVRIALEKRIPIGAGLGGGSADAAFTLVALDRLLSAGWAAERLSGFAARFGSDVPFFVHAALGSPGAACRGRGEVVRPVAPPAQRWALVVSPPFTLSTRDVYARFDELHLGDDAVLDAAAEPDWRAWANLPARELLGRLVNDLEPAAFSVRPELAGLRTSLERRLGRVVRMSGSGSSLFTLYDAADEPAAREAVLACEASSLRAVAAEVAPANLNGPGTLW
jgi:4-diphosphocytidyl-2C-methyl-D-erythritol kinase